LSGAAGGPLGQFAGQRLGGDDRIGLLFLAVIKAPALVIVTAGEVRGFHKRPSQILVAAFAVVLAFLFAIALAQALHAPAVAGKVAGVGEAFGVTGFEGDGQAEDRSIPRLGSARTKPAVRRRWRH